MQTSQGCVGNQKGLGVAGLDGAAGPNKVGCKARRPSPYSCLHPVQDGPCHLSRLPLLSSLLPPSPLLPASTKPLMGSTPSSNSDPSSPHPLHPSPPSNSNPPLHPPTLAAASTRAGWPSQLPGAPPHSCTTAAAAATAAWTTDTGVGASAAQPRRDRPQHVVAQLNVTSGGQCCWCDWQARCACMWLDLRKSL